MLLESVILRELLNPLRDSGYHRSNVRLAESNTSLPDQHNLACPQEAAGCDANQVHATRHLCVCVIQAMPGNALETGLLPVGQEGPHLLPKDVVNDDLDLA